jgi:hypothetical protein
MSVIISGTDNFVLNADSLGTAAAGAFDYDGKVFYVTPQGTQRGVVPGAQFFRLDSALVGSNVNTAQNVLGVGVTLSSSTVYAFQLYFVLTKSAGSTSRTISIGFGGTATINNVAYTGILNSANTTYPVGLIANPSSFENNTVAATVFLGASTATTTLAAANFQGTVSVNAGGTFIPQYTLSAAPGGAFSTIAGSYMMIYPIGASGANVNVGTWA